MVETLILGAAFIFGLIGTAAGVTALLLFRKFRSYSASHSMRWRVHGRQKR